MLGATHATNIKQNKTKTRNKKESLRKNKKMKDEIKNVEITLFEIPFTKEVC